MTPDRWQLIERLYNGALERPRSERSAWLDDACGGDQELRQSVDALLKQRVSEVGFLVTPPQAVAAVATDTFARSLVSGSRVGAFEIQSLLGSGGMGDVYRARDTRLNRLVAIKFLSPGLADTHARRRFQQEALTASSLNHPNIITVFEAGDFDGHQYLVTELVEGGTLAEWRRAHTSSWQRIVELLMGVADGLAIAHEAGILHRDIKPANILVARSGYAKLADFGLAKLTAGAGEHDQTRIADVGTRSGFIVGTIPYMSPEQAIGGPADQRSDLFSFGVVLYEMLAGKRPFHGGTDLERLQAVVHREAHPLREVRGDLPDALHAIVHKTLEKNPADRYQTARELVSDLRQVVRQFSEGVPSPPHVRNTRRHLILAACSVLVAGALAAVMWLRFPASSNRATAATRLSVTLPADQTLNADSGAAPLAISPDGRRVVYVADHGTERQLFVRDLEAFESHGLDGTKGAQYPFFSPDGRSVGFFAGGKLLRVSLGGGSPVPVCEVPVISHGATWGRDGTIVYDPGTSGLMRVAAEGGRPELLRSGDATMDERDFHWPQFLPDGRALLATVGPASVTSARSSIAVFSFGTRQWRVLTDGTQPQYLPLGYLAYHADHVREGELQAVAFDVKELTVRGTPVPFMSGVFRARSGGAADHAISPSGTLVFAPDGLARTLVRVERNGRRTQASEDHRGYRFPRFSPDGRSVAVTIDPRPSEIWVYDLERGSRMQLTAGRNSVVPVWSPDGRRIIFTTGGGLYSRPADGSSAAERLLEFEGGKFAHSWSRDGRFLFFHDLGRPANKSDIWVLPVGGQPHPVLATAASESHPAISPDSRWLAYQSDQSGHAEIYVRPYPDVDAGQWPISINGGHSPLWSHAGREIFYMNGPNLMTAAVRVDGTKFMAGTPTVLFSGPFDTTQDNNYDVSPDGSHFIMVEAAPDPALRALQVVLNWSVELERLVNVKNAVK